MRRSSVYGFGAATFAAGDQAMATGCCIACGCIDQQDVIVDVAYGLDRGVRVLMAGKPLSR
jgi:hypothetical protein